MHAEMKSPRRMSSDLVASSPTEASRPSGSDAHVAPRLNPALVIGVGVATAVQLPHTYAMVTAGTVVSLLALPFMLTRAHEARVLRFATTGVVACLALIAAARFNNVASDRQAALAFLCLALMSIAVHIGAGGRVDRIISIVCGVEIGTIIFNTLDGYANTQGSFANLWKYGGVGAAVTVLALAAVNLRREWLWQPIVVLGSLSVLTLFLNFRSHSIICLTTICVLLAKHDKAARGRVSIRTWLVGALVLVALAYLPGAFLHGDFGRAVQLKTQQQVQGGGPALLAGRDEPPLSISAIVERPFGGWGDADNISGTTIDRASSLAGHLGMHDYKTYLPVWIRPDGTVSLHSIALSAWAEGGVLAAICPLLIIGISVRLAFAYSGRWSALVTFLALQAIWDLTFSPWTYNQSAILACIFALSLAASPTIKRRRLRREGAATRAGR
jgi:hypothetical protein